MTDTWKALEEDNRVSMQLDGSELNWRDQLFLLATYLPHNAENTFLKDQEFNAEFLGSNLRGKIFHEKGWHGGIEKRLTYRQKCGEMKKFTLQKKITRYGSSFLADFYTQISLKIYEIQKMIKSYFF